MAEIEFVAHISLEGRHGFKSSIIPDIPALEEFGENPADGITDDVLNQARDLTIAVYPATVDHFEDSDLSKLGAYKFLNNRSTTFLKLLPPTEDAPEKGCSSNTH